MHALPIFLLLLSSTASTTAIHHRSSRVRTPLRRAGQNIAANSERKLSPDDQLDILRLGFIPASRADDNDECRPRIRGGGMDDGDSALINKPELSTEDQLDILKLGFIPTTKPRGLARFHIPRGGSIDTLKEVISSRGVLSTSDELDILRLGFISPSSPSHTIYHETAKTDYRYRSIGSSLQLQNRGGNIDSDSSNKSLQQRSNSIQPLAFASIMASLAGCSDAICYKRFNCYAAMMSGNVVTLSIAIAERQWKDVMWKASLIGSYLLGSASVRSIETFVSRRFTSESPTSQAKQRQHHKVVAPIVVVVFAIANEILLKNDDDSHVTKLAEGYALLAWGYGMVYATANKALNGTITQLLTGHITKMGTAISDVLFGRSITDTTKDMYRFSACILGSFIIGGIIGGQFVSSDLPLFSLLGVIYAIVLAMF